MIRLDTYSGDLETLAGFVTSVWQKSYGGKMVFPHWDADFFRWQLRWHDATQQLFRIAAYDGSRLIATLLGVSYDYRLGQKTYPGVLWSWLTIDPGSRGQGLARLLDQERRRRMQLAQKSLIVSFRYLGSKHSLAEHPTAALKSGRSKFQRKFGTWVRVLNPAKVSGWSLSSMDAWLARITAPLAGVPEVPARYRSQIRLMREADLPGCLALLQKQTSGDAFSQIWTLDTLKAHLLQPGPVTTVVFEEQGEVRGLICFYILPHEARTVEPVAFFDIVALEHLSGSARNAMIRGAMREMIARGAILAVKPRFGNVPGSLMLGQYYMPRPPESWLVLDPLNEPHFEPFPGRYQLIWR